MSAVAQQNEVVQFVLQGGPNQGQVRDAAVADCWGGSDAAGRAAEVAAHPRYQGWSVDEVLAEFGMRATLDIKLLAGDMTDEDVTIRVTNAEHDPAGQRPGCWFRTAELPGYVPPDSAWQPDNALNDGGQV